MRDVLKELGDGLAAWEGAGNHNRVAGNRDRTAGVRLQFAVEEAVAWTAEPISHRDERKAGVADRDILAALTRDERNAMTNALAWIDDPLKHGAELPVPHRRNEHAFMISRLFLALRFTFLQDNEVLPAALRTIRDPRTGKLGTVKTHDKAARMRGARYSFSDFRGAIEADQARKVSAVPAGAPYEAYSAAYQIDYGMKREASALRSKSVGALAPDTLFAMSALGQAVRRGFLAP